MTQVFDNKGQQLMKNNTKKQVIYIPRTMPTSVRIQFSLFISGDARLRSNFKNSCFVFHRGFQTLENDKSTWPVLACRNRDNAISH